MGEYIDFLNTYIWVSKKYPHKQQIATIIFLPMVVNILVVPMLMVNCIVLFSTK